MRDKNTRFELAPQDKLAPLEYLAPRFFREVVGLEYSDVLVTDESDLFDFADVTGDREQEVQRMLLRMGATYGIDPSHIQSTKITDLLQFLSVYEAGKVPHE
jgi:hypothetical protein